MQFRNQSISGRHTLAMQPLITTPRASPTLIWLLTMLASGFVGVAVIALRYDEFLDCSNPEQHESANTPLGWSVAVLATMLPLAIAALLRPRQRRLMVAAVLVACIQIPIWVWALNPSGCDWMS